MIAVEVADLLYEYGSNTAILILREKEGRRVVPISYGVAEAWSLGHQLTGGTFSRPPTSAFITALLAVSGASLEHIAIYGTMKVEMDFGGTSAYLTRAVLRCGDEIREVETRPSDVLPVALRLNRPVYVTEELLYQADQVFPPGSEANLGSGLGHLARLIQKHMKPENASVLDEDEEISRERYAQEKAVRELLSYLLPPPGPPNLWSRLDRVLGQWRRKPRKGEAGRPEETLPIPHQGSSATAATPPVSEASEEAPSHAS